MHFATKLYYPLPKGPLLLIYTFGRKRKKKVPFPLTVLLAVLTVELAMPVQKGVPHGNSVCSTSKPKYCSLLN